MKVRVFKRAGKKVNEAREALGKTGFNPELAERIMDSLFTEMVTKPTRYDLKDGLMASMWKLLAPFLPSFCCRSFCCPSFCQLKQDEPWLEWKKRGEVQDGKRRLRREQGCWPWRMSCPFRVNWLNNDMLKVMVLPPIEMAKDLENLDYLIKMITELKEPALPDTWLDIFETWMSVRDLTSVMRTEMCQIVLQCIFSDPDVMNGLAFVERFEGIEGKPPSGLLKKMKQVSTSQACAHANPRTHTHTLVGARTHADPWGAHEVPGVHVHPGAQNRNGAHQTYPGASEPPRNLGGHSHHVRARRTGQLRFDLHLRKVLRHVRTVLLIHTTSVDKILRQLRLY